MKDRLFQIWFSLRCGAANTEFVGLLEQHGSPYAIFSMEDAEIERLTCSQRLKRAFSDKSLQESYRILSYCEENGIDLLFWSDEAYPTSLRSLKDPPSLLYVKGRLPELSRALCVSVVGTRKMSEYGKQMAYKIGYELASAGAVVVSGLALGNDSVATAGALAANGRTVAVLGCGIDIVYPPQHATLSRQILQSGALITEYPPGSPPEGYHFPARNRLISGLGQGTVVIEAIRGSGALITARKALLQGRDIYAVPGNVGCENTFGTNQLIHDGAVMVQSARDILENYTFLYRDSLNMTGLLKAEGKSDADDAWLARLKVSSACEPTKAKATGKSNACIEQRPKVDAKAGAENVKEKTAPRISRESPCRKAARSLADRVVKPAGAVVTADAGAAMSGLNDKQKRLLEMLPLDRSASLDELTRERDGQKLSVGEVLSAMTVLEIKGLVQSLPGGLYVRK